MKEKIKSNNWQDAIAKEMENVKDKFQVIPNSEKAPDGYQFVNCHMVFDLKMEEFRRRAELVMEGHVTQMLNIIT